MNLNHLNIAFLAGTLDIGGAEQQLFYIVKALLHHGARTRVLSLTRGEHWEGPIRDLGAPVIWVGERPGIAARVRRIVGELRGDRPNVVQSMHFYVNPYAAAASRWLGIADFGALRSDVFSEVADCGRILGPICLRSPRCLIANSQSAVENAVSLGIARDRLRFLPNAIDLRRFEASALTDEKPGSADSPIRLLTVGRLVASKRIDRFLELTAWLNAQGTEAVAIIAGDGPQRSELERRASELGLGPDRVRFLGQSTEMAGVYREADIFVLTSEFEGTPNVVIEAMACALPVVSVPVGDVSSLIESERTGMIVERESELRDAVLRLARDPLARRAIGQAARAAIEQERSLDGLGRRLAEVYGCRM